jgi:hypothetical protein
LLSIDEKIAEVQAKLTATAATPDTSNKALRLLQDLKTRVASQTSIAQILYLQGQGGDAMDEAITLIETAMATSQPTLLNPATSAKPVQTGASNVPPPVAKTTRVVRAADFSSKSYLESEPDVEAYVSKLKAELLAVVRSGQKARVQ